MLLRRPLLLLCLAASASVASVADARPSAELAAAKALFNDARADVRRGDYAAACPKFRESYRLSPAVGVLLNLADCDDRSGHLLSARERFEQGLARLPHSDSRVGYVRSRIRKLEDRTPHLTGSVPEGARVFLDGNDVTAPRIIAPVDPGPHTVEVRLSPDRGGSLVVDLSESEQKEVDFAAILPPPPPPAEVAHDADNAERGLERTSSEPIDPDAFVARRNRVSGGKGRRQRSAVIPERPRRVEAAESEPAPRREIPDLHPRRTDPQRALKFDRIRIESTRRSEPRGRY